MSAESASQFLAQCETAGIALSTGQQQCLAVYVALLVEWNTRINLTRERETAQIYTRHVLDSLMAAPLLDALPPAAGGTPSERFAADLGSGAGLPGLMWAVICPHLHLTSVERAGKKVEFQQAAVQAMGLANVTVLQSDGKALAQSPAGREHFHLVTARAVAPLRKLLPLAGGLLRPGGELWAYKGERLAEEEVEVPRHLWGKFSREGKRLHYRLPGSSGPGVIAVYRKL